MQAGSDNLRRRGQGQGQIFRAVVVNKMMSIFPDVHIVSIYLLFFVSLVSVLLSFFFFSFSLFLLCSPCLPLYLQVSH